MGLTENANRNALQTLPSETSVEIIDDQLCGLSQDPF